MAGVWNINSIYNSSQKKISGKLTFQLGEVLAARVISLSEDGKNIVVRTLDGWQFPALLEEPIINLPEGLIKLQIDGYDGGTVKLKVVQQVKQGETNEQESLRKIIEGNNLSDEDKLLLKAMAAFSMPLNRENISKIKSLENFISKIKNNEEEIQQFISKYLNSKNIEPSSEAGIKIKNTLKNFFQELKTLSLEDILLLEEVGIDLTEENIKSFNNIFKEPQGLNKALEGIFKEVNTITGAKKVNEKNENEMFSVINPKEIDSTDITGDKLLQGERKVKAPSEVIRGSMNSGDTFVKLENNVKTFLKEKFEKIYMKIIDDIDSFSYSTNIDDIVDNLIQEVRPFATASDGMVADALIKRVPNEKTILTMTLDTNQIEDKMKAISNAIVSEINSNEDIEWAVKDFKNNLKQDIRENLFIALATEDPTKSIIVDNKVTDRIVAGIAEEVRPFLPSIGSKELAEISKKLVAENGEAALLIKPEQIKEHLEEMNTVIKGEIDSRKDIKHLIRDLRDIVKSSIEEKLNNVYDNGANESDVPINKQIINRTAEKITASVQEILKFGQDIEVGDIIKNIVEKNPEIETLLEAEELKGLLENIGKKDSKLNVIREKSINPAVDIIMEEIKNKLEDIKSMVRSVINSKSEQGTETWNNIMNNLKANVNDLKIFNSISGQYYYMDIPIKMNDNNYPCKLIVKDDRKKGKKIDAGNVKLAVSIATINMGVVDAYLSVKDKNMQINFRCDEKWTKILDIAKQKLWKVLNTSVYNISINVSKREKTMDITSCREFFEDTHSSNINTMV